MDNKRNWMDQASAALGPTLFDYLRGRPHDMRDGDIDPNEAALSRYRLVPRILTGCQGVDLACAIFGRMYAAPIGVGAFAADRLFDAAGVAAIGRVCARLRLPLFVSEEAVTPLADVIATGADCWLQLRAAGPVARAERLVLQAADAGCKGIVLTVLAPVHPVPGLHPGGVDVAAEIASRGWSTIGAVEGVARLPAFPAWSDIELTHIVAHAHACGMKIIVKGVLHPMDAKMAVDAGCDGVMVSNIGVRQLYRWAPAIDQLPTIREALLATRRPIVGDDAPSAPASILIDGGIRQAADIIVACILGAQMAVLVRPVAYALAAGGESGVEQMLSGLIGELTAVCAWMGAANISALGTDQLTRLDAV